MKDVIRHDPCSYCGGPADTVDHIIPVAERGTRKVENGWPNITAACISCNLRKRNLPLLEFLLDPPLSAAAKKLYRIRGSYFTSAQIEQMRRAVG